MIISFLTRQGHIETLRGGSSQKISQKVEKLKSQKLGKVHNPKCRLFLDEGGGVQQFSGFFQIQITEIRPFGREAFFVGFLYSIP